MTWHSPSAFFLLLPLLCVLIYWRFFSKRAKGALFYSGLSLIPKEGFYFRASLAFLPNFLKWAALAVIVLALARPQTAERLTRQSQEGLDIMIVLDISLSMLVEDMGNMTRLESAKQVVRNFIDGRPNDRMGLIVFSGESFTTVPLTLDHGLLKNSLSRVKTLSSIKDGTAIGVALANATARLRHSPEDSRIIIFLTDGENNTGFIDPETAGQLVRKNKIKAYTIGLGSQSGHFPIKYEAQDALGRSVYRKMYVSGHINKELMKKISSQTGGEFFMAKNLSSLKKIFAQIDALETYKIQTDKWTKWTERFENFLLPGAILYLLSVFLSLTVFFRGI